MIAFGRNLCTAFVILCGVLFIYGFVAEKMRLSEIDDKREYVVMVTDTDADESYFWLTVEGCSAEVTDDGIACGLGWYGRSDREWRHGKKQTPVPFRDAPRGVLLRFEAVVSDRDGKARGSASFITTRGF
jgi:hypothetical protein